MEFIGFIKARLVDYDNLFDRFIKVPVPTDVAPFLPTVVKIGSEVAIKTKESPATYKNYGEIFKAEEL